MTSTIYWNDPDQTPPPETETVLLATREGTRAGCRTAGRFFRDGKDRWTDAGGRAIAKPAFWAAMPEAPTP